MGIRLKNNELKIQHKKLKFIHWMIFALIVLSTFFEIVEGHRLNIRLFLLPVFYFAHKAYFRTIQKLFYTFWTFSGLFSIYLAHRIIYSYINYKNPIIISNYALALILLASECYILFSPIYYPIVRWWEYDFRFKSDFKIMIEKGSEHFEGRLTDLRRDAGCVVSFENFKVGQYLNIHYSNEVETITLVAEVASKRILSFGRGHYYGVHFRFKNKPSQISFKNLCKEWNDVRKRNILIKFSNHRAKVAS